ncbi:MAG TPA: glycosyltransferase [Usitatibacter sp.]|nr:glycosyltransferase [Usitatibacter sp.]
MSAWVAVFALSLGALAYTFAGYPLLLWLRARLRPRPVHKARFEPPVVIVIAMHDGARDVVRKVQSCLAQDYPPDRLRVVVASDGSSDGSDALVAALGDPRVRLLRFEARRGKAACLVDAVGATSEPFIVFTDVRQALDPLAVRRLMENMADPAVAAVSGKLVTRVEGACGFAQGIDAYLRFEQALRRLESRGGSLVGVTGALYALRRERFQPIPASTVLDDMLIPLNAARLGQRIVFEEGAIAYEPLAADPARERSRKVRTLAGNFQLLRAHPWLLVPWQNPVAFELFSHKVLRLGGPLFLAAAFASNLVLAPAHPAFAALFVLQAAAYGCAACAKAFPATTRWKAVSLAGAFVSLNLYVLLAAREFLSNGDVHLWQPSPAPVRSHD